MQWKVKEGTQVARDDNLYVGGDTFSATEEEVNAEGLSTYVEKAERKAAKAEEKAEKAEDKAEVKAQQSSANKATQPEQNKGSK